ncbi:MAG: hypothetical protein AAF992_21235 [Bacteroidota bacterium]
MRKIITRTIFAFLLILTFASCEEEVECGCVFPPNEYFYTFEAGSEGWESGFADYPVGEDNFYELSSELAPLPEPLDQNQQAFMIAGNNHSDDLFMFITNKVTNLTPNATYRLVVEAELASDAPENSAGIGGSPGSSVYFKAGAFSQKPEAIEQDGYWRMNLDKGNQSQGGTDMQVLGTVGTDLEDFTYTLINRDNRNSPLQVKANDQGELWVIVGTDSGFEGKTTLYYNRITVRLLD